MRTRFGFLAVTWLSLIGCASPQPAVRCPEPAIEEPSTPEVADHGTSGESRALTRVFLVRHAEKADDGTKDPPLLPAGTVRAECLAQTLGDLEVTHLFATDLQRTALTLQPLATAKGVQVRVLPASDIESLAKSLRSLPAGSVAVVAGHSNSIPDLTELLGAQLPGLSNKGHIPETEHDRLIELVFSDGASASSLSQLRYCAPS